MSSSQQVCDVATTSQHANEEIFENLPADTIKYKGLHTIYSQMMEVDQLISCPQAKSGAGKYYSELNSSFEQF